jgi:hypothetical protein
VDRLSKQKDKMRKFSRYVTKSALENMLHNADAKKKRDSIKQKLTLHLDEMDKQQTISFQKTNTNYLQEVTDMEDGMEKLTSVFGVSEVFAETPVYEGQLPFAFHGSAKKPLFSKMKSKSLFELPIYDFDGSECGHLLIVQDYISEDMEQDILGCILNTCNGVITIVDINQYQAMQQSCATFGLANDSKSKWYTAKAGLHFYRPDGPKLHPIYWHKAGPVPDKYPVLCVKHTIPIVDTPFDACVQSKTCSETHDTLSELAKSNLFDFHAYVVGKFLIAINIYKVDMPEHSDGKAHRGSAVKRGQIGQEVIGTIKLFRSTVSNVKTVYLHTRSLGFDLSRIERIT